MTMENNLKPEERLDELHRNGYVIIQNPKKFCFGMDAVLLSGFAKVKQGELALDYTDSFGGQDRRGAFYRAGNSGRKR